MILKSGVFFFIYISFYGMFILSYCFDCHNFWIASYLDSSYYMDSELRDENGYLDNWFGNIEHIS